MLGDLLAYWVSAVWFFGLIEFLSCHVCWLAVSWMVVFMYLFGIRCCLATALDKRTSFGLYVLIGLMARWVVGFSLLGFCFTEYLCWHVGWLAGFWMLALTDFFISEAENGSLIWKAWRLHFGTLDDRFGTSGAPWKTVGAAGRTCGGLESNCNRLRDDLGSPF